MWIIDISVQVTKCYYIQVAEYLFCAAVCEENQNLDYIF
jgi:hypothetical protein